MSSLLNNPAVQSSLLPLLLALGLTGLIRLLLGPVVGVRLASAALAFGFLASLILIQAPVFPPRSASQKLPYLVAAAMLLGLMLDGFNLRGRKVQATCIVLSLATLGWLLGSRFDRIDLAGWVLVVLLIALSLLAERRCVQRHDTLNSGIILLFASGGIGAISLIGASASIAQTGFALMAACGGFLLWNWPRFRYPLGATAQLVLITALLALSTQLLFFTKASGWALLLLTPLLLTDILLSHIPGLNRVTHPAVRALCLAGIAALICALAIGTAQWLSQSGGNGY